MRSDKLLRSHRANASLAATLTWITSEPDQHGLALRVTDGQPCHPDLHRRLEGPRHPFTEPRPPIRCWPWSGPGEGVGCALDPPSRSVRVPATAGRARAARRALR